MYTVYSIWREQVMVVETITSNLNIEKCILIHVFQGFMIINVAFLLPPVDPPADSGWTNSSLSRNSSGRNPPNPQGHECASFE